MFDVLVQTILPIFSIIFLGYFLKMREVIGADYARTANQIVFSVAIPAMILNEIAQAPFGENFNLGAVLCVLAALVTVTLASLGLMLLLKVSPNRRGTFLQSSFHGNIGYLSYAIAYYALGAEPFARMAILSSFVMMGQNFLAVWALTTFNTEFRQGRPGWDLLKHLLRNPILVTVLLGVIYSALGFSIPKPFQKGLDILGGMAFPTALLLIGASLSFGAFRLMVREIIGIGVMKLLCLPFLGYTFMVLAGVPQNLLLPGIILLAAPPATVTYIMAMELGGHPELAATSVSIFTLISAFTYSLILTLFAG